MLDGSILAAVVVHVAGAGAGSGVTPAYIDPGSGSLILQAAAAGLVGAALMVRRFRDNIAGGLRHAATRVSAIVRREGHQS
jgi:hypothetical protein